MSNLVNQAHFWIVLALVIINVHADPVTYDMKLTCNMDTDIWCANVLIYEVDHGFDNDPWSISSACTTKDSHTFFSPDFYPGGDQYKSHHYEIKFLVFHNCTTRESDRGDKLDRCDCTRYNMDEKKGSVFKLLEFREDFTLYRSGVGITDDRCRLPGAFGTLLDGSLNHSGITSVCNWDQSDMNVTKTHSFIHSELRPAYEHKLW